MSSSEFKIDLKFFSTGIDEVINGFTKLKGAMDQANAGTTSLATSTKSIGTATEKAKPSLLQLGTAFGTVTASGWSLYNAYDSLEKVKAASAKADVTAQKAAMAATAAQKAYNEAVSKSGAGSKDATDAALKLAVAKENLANKMEMAQIKAGDVTEAYAQFATTLPTMILSVANAGVTFQKMVKDMGGIHQIVPQVTSSLQAVGGALKTLALNPIGLILTAVAAVFVLLATNAFGFRDAVNALGKAIGDALPFLQPFLELIGGAANWFLNLINPVQEASAQLDTLGTSVGGAGTAMEETQVQVEGLGGALIDQGDVITDVMGFNDDLMAKESDTAAAYDAYKKARLTGNTEIIDSYNLTGEEITKFKEQYEKDMEDAQKAAEDAAKASYEAWKKSRDDINSAIEGGFGVIKSAVDKMKSDLVSAAEEGGKEFKKTMKGYGLTRDSDVVYGAVIDVLVAPDADKHVTGFTEMIISNLDSLKLGSAAKFKTIIGDWIQIVKDERPQFATEAQQLGDEIITKMDAAMNGPDKLNPAQAFLAAINTILNPTDAAEMAKLFGISILDTTAATFTADTKVTTAVDSLTAKIDAALGKGLSTLPTTTGTEVGKIGPAITAQESKATTASSDMTAAMNAIFGTDLTKIPSVVNTEFGKVPPAITTNSSKAQTATQTMATQINTKVKTIGTQATTTASTVSTEFGTTIPNAAKKMQTDSKPEMDTMVTNTKKFASDMKAELSPIAQLFKDVLKLPTVPPSKAMTTSPSPNYNKGTLTQNAELSPEQIAELFKFPESQPEEITQNAELGDYTTQTNALEQFTQFVSKKTTEISAMFLTMKNSVTATMTQLQTVLGAFATTAMGTIATAVSTQTTLVSAHFLTMKNSVTITITALQTLLGAFASTTLSTIATAVSTQTTVMSAAFLTMKTSVTTQIIALQTLLGAFASSTLSTVASAVTQQTTTMSASFLTMKDSITLSITSIATTITTQMIGTAQKMATDTKTHTTSVSASFTTMTSSLASSVAKAVSEMNKFVTSLKSVSTQAAAAKKDVDALAKSVNALKDKEITIHVGIEGPGVSYLQHGGAFITGLSGQHGYAGIVSSPGKVGGVRVGEGFRPELVTVTPLTRGTGNRTGPTMGGGFGSPGGRGGGEIIANITVVLDGRVIQRFVEKTALAGIGMQI